MMEHAERVVAGLLRGTFAPPPKLEETREQKQERIIAEIRKERPNAVIVTVYKRKSGSVE